MKLVQENKYDLGIPDTVAAGNACAKANGSTMARSASTGVQPFRSSNKDRSKRQEARTCVTDHSMQMIKLEAAAWNGRNLPHKEKVHILTPLLQSRTHECQTAHALCKYHQQEGCTAVHALQCTWNVSQIRGGGCVAGFCCQVRRHSSVKPISKEQTSLFHAELNSLRHPLLQVSPSSCGL
ncbi:hypothetical protein NDU88_006137 [Pleurodeles waltl]|uniref:Uncharacterized protein n=1 Tax=Pleurodeles waltl TaxID=8319 RepID=A0AAV7SNW1_PLEWA|nr:hypothetical protein NDU88_006137 [Pleurodeles waltl]